jgi:hypothetical protein
VTVEKFRLVSSSKGLSLHLGGLTRDLPRQWQKLKVEKGQGLSFFVVVSGNLHCVSAESPKLLMLNHNNRVAIQWRSLSSFNDFFLRMVSFLSLIYGKDIIRVQLSEFSL